MRAAPITLSTLVATNAARTHATAAGNALPYNQGASSENSKGR
jgi:hypothetical protein